ncbi:hypothetical protein GGR55DRAFT_211862 [Xylaria sp. FL0064]|nr:hypothetical protein GGR55DRAFT_211862 [Xylaria sp. FL0064]
MILRSKLESRMNCICSHFNFLRYHCTYMKHIKICEYVKYVKLFYLVLSGCTRYLAKPYRTIVAPVSASPRGKEGLLRVSSNTTSNYTYIQLWKSQTRLFYLRRSSELLQPEHIHWSERRPTRDYHAELPRSNKHPSQPQPRSTVPHLQQTTGWRPEGHSYPRITPSPRGSSQSSFLSLLLQSPAQVGTSLVCQPVAFFFHLLSLISYYR